jgi:hypothetical protein
MVSPRRALVLAGLAVAFSAPLAAVQYTITLTNGTTFESRYKPLDAEYDAQKIFFIDGAGNIVSLAKSDVATIEADTASKGYGHMLDDTAMAFGWAPNDKGEYNPNEAIATSEEAAAPEEPIYNVNETPAQPIFYTVPSDAVAPQTMVPAPAPAPPPAAEPPPA